MQKTAYTLQELIDDERIPQDPPDDTRQVLLLNNHEGSLFWTIGHHTGNGWVNAMFVPSDIILRWYELPSLEGFQYKTLR